MNGGVVLLEYDGDGNRVAKTANGVTTRYLVDDLNPTGYAQVVEEVVGGAGNAANGPTANGPVRLYKTDRNMVDTMAENSWLSQIWLDA
jgi:hypothetical protein